MNIAFNLDIKYETEVFVAGGGPAGIAAAVCCARQGKSVFLAEAGGCFGGLGTAGLVPEIMTFTDGINFLAGGIGREIRDELFGDNGNARRAYTIQVEKVKRLYDRLVENSGVKFLFFTKVAAVKTDSVGHVEYAVLSSKSGLYAVKAKIFIDCTGDGEMAVMAGADFEYGGDQGESNPASVCSLWANIDFSKRENPDNHRLTEAIEDGIFSQKDLLLPGIFPVDLERGVGGGNVGHCFDVDSTDEESMTRAMISGRKGLLEYERYYKKYLTGFENMALCVTSNVLGIRESRRITGDARLVEEHYYNCACFKDEIGRYSYPIDIHPEKPNLEEMEKFSNRINACHEDGQSYGIPYGALIPAKLDNMLVAGRCISADRLMQASIRVIPGCYITGQAAGVAASLAVEKQDVRAIEIEELQAKLVAAGAYLPNAKL